MNTQKIELKLGTDDFKWCQHIFLKLDLVKTYFYSAKLNKLFIVRINNCFLCDMDTVSTKGAVNVVSPDITGLCSRDLASHCLASIVCTV